MGWSNGGQSDDLGWYKIGGSSLDPATTAWVAAVVSAGGTVSAGQKTNVNTLIVALKAHSLFTTQDAIWLHSGESVSQQALIDIVNLRVATPHNSPTLSNSGYQGNGSSAYIDTGIAPSGLSNYSQNSGSISAYVVNSRTGSNNGIAISSHETASFGSYSYIQPNISNLAVWSINVGQFPTVSNANAQGFYTASRTSSSSNNFYENLAASAFGTDTSASDNISAMPNFFILADNLNGTAGQFSSDTIGIITIGAGMSQSQVAQFHTDLNAYMTAIGTNVY